MTEKDEQGYKYAVVMEIVGCPGAHMVLDAFDDEAEAEKLCRKMADKETHKDSKWLVRKLPSFLIDKLSNPSGSPDVVIA